MFTGHGFFSLGHGFFSLGHGFFSLGHGFFFLGHGFFSLGHGFFFLGHGFFFLGHGFFSLGHGLFSLGHGFFSLGHGFFFLGRSVFQSRLFRFFLLYAGLIFAVIGDGFLYGFPYKLFYFVYNILPEQVEGFFGSGGITGCAGYFRSLRRSATRRLPQTPGLRLGCRTAGPPIGGCRVVFERRCWREGGSTLRLPQIAYYSR
jgi:hypothetical protein